MLHTRFGRAVAAALLVALALGTLAWLSFTTTQRRTYGALSPFVVSVEVVDAAGRPVAHPRLRLLDATTLEAADAPAFELDMREGLQGDEHGRIELRFVGQRVEIEDWRLLWVFPITRSGPPRFSSYLVSISATGKTPWMAELPALLTDPAEGEAAPLRYSKRVILP